MKDGIIQPGTERGNKLGFTAERFHGWLWKDGDRILISMIESRDPGKGRLSELFAAIKLAGFKVAVPTPFPHMQAILERKGFVRTVENDEVMGPVEVWTEAA